MTPEELYERDLPTLQHNREKRRAEAKTSRDPNYVALMPEAGVYLAKSDCGSTAVALLAGYLQCPSSATVWERVASDTEVGSILHALDAEHKVRPFHLFLS